MACGTAVSVIPIRSITMRSTGSKFVYKHSQLSSGSCAAKLMVMLDDIYRGRADDKFGWLVKVLRPLDRRVGLESEHCTPSVVSHDSSMCEGASA